MPGKTTAFYDGATPLIDATHQPALVHELSLAHGVPLEQPAPALLTPAEHLRMLATFAQRFDSPEAAFVIGRHLLPGHYGAASHALRQARDLRHALELLVRHAARLSPLLVPRFMVEDELAVVYWNDACRLGTMRRFVVEMEMAALVSLCRWRSGGTLPWTFCLATTATRHPEQLEVHLGSPVRLNCQLDAMLISPDWLDRPWPAADAASSAAAGRAAQAAAQREDLPQPLLGALYETLLREARRPPALEACAARFGLSPATFKRRLAAEGTHFQAELDRVRSHVALHLFRFRGLDNEAVADHLGFHDAANFRRSFKRWTGLTPSLLRRSLLLPQPG